VSRVYQRVVSVQEVWGMDLGMPPSGEAPEPAGLEPEPGLASPHVTAAMVASGREAYGGGQSGTVHSFSVDEELAYANHINETLDGDVDCGHQLPIDTADMQTMYDAIADGLVIPKLINAVINDEKLHIDRRALNRKKKLHPIQKVENHNLAINTCINIGVRVVNIGAMDLIEGKK
jgi:plastin-1